MKQKAIIVDLDGTLQQVTSRKRFIDSKEWRKFHAASAEELPNLWCLDIVNRFKHDHDVFFITGRKNEHREITENWLLVQCELKPSDYELFMAPPGMIALPFKKKVYLEKIEPHYQVTLVLDDDPDLVAMWRELGLTCLQPNFD